MARWTRLDAKMCVSIQQIASGLTPDPLSGLKVPDSPDFFVFWLSHYLLARAAIVAAYKLFVYSGDVQKAKPEVPETQAKNVMADIRRCPGGPEIEIVVSSGSATHPWKGILLRSSTTPKWR